jgi:transposase
MPQMRQKISVSDKQRLINSYQCGGDYVSLAKHLNIKESTARSCVQRFKNNSHPGTHGGHKRCLLTDEIFSILEVFIQENPLATLAIIKGYLQSVCELNVSSNTIANWLDGRLITLKRMRDVPHERNSVSTKDKRCEYAQWMIENNVMEGCVYIDESGFNLWTKRSYGRSKKGQRCFIVDNGQRGENISLCLAIGFVGVLHSKIIVGAFNREKYTEFITELSELLAGSAFHFVMDNCRIHYGVNVNLQEHSIRFLPPYSPFLNPIEAAFSALKAEVKARLSAPGFNVGYTHPERRVTLLNTITSALPVVTASKCQAFYRHSYTFLARCIQKVDILGD